MPNPLSKLVNPRYPATAFGFEKGIATMVQLERGRGGSSNLKRAATVALPESLIRPSFDEPNISDPTELAAALQRSGHQRRTAAAEALVRGFAGRDQSQSDFDARVAAGIARGT